MWAYGRSERGVGLNQFGTGSITWLHPQFQSSIFPRRIQGLRLVKPAICWIAMVVLSCPCSPISRRKYSPFKEGPLTVRSISWLGETCRMASQSINSMHGRLRCGSVRNPEVMVGIDLVVSKPLSIFPFFSLSRTSFLGSVPSRPHFFSPSIYSLIISSPDLSTFNPNFSGVVISKSWGQLRRMAS